MRKKLLNKNKKEILHKIVTLVVAMNFLFIQTALPYSINSIALASEEEAVQEQAEEEEEVDQEQEPATEEEEEQATEEEEEPATEEEAAEESGAGEEPADQQQAEATDPDVLINGENDATADNQAESVSNTGENEIANEEERQEPSEACKLELEEYERSLQQEVAEGEQQNIFELSADCKQWLDEEQVPAIDPEQEIQELQETAQAQEQLLGLEEETSQATAPADEDSDNEEDGDEEEESKDEEDKTEEELAQQQAAEELERTARDLGEDATIDTGVAKAISNIYNEINENIIGTNWVDTAFNIYGIYEGDINLLEIFEKLFEILANNATELIGSIQLDVPENKNGSDDSVEPGQKEPAGEEGSVGEGDQKCGSGCDGINVEINNTNNADLDNEGTAVANTGKNEITANEGDATINTGNAFAMVNIVNVVNRNIVGENWLFVIINIFGDWTGNLIVPGADLLHLPSAFQFANLNVNNRNNADVNNEVLAGANTGGNEAIGNGGDANISSGDAYSDGNVTNILNTNIIGSNWFSLSINNMGNWAGGISNWYGGEGALQYDFSADETILAAGSLTVNNANNATIDNKAVSYANTGDNAANYNGGDAAITTGDAIASGNIVNFVNTNIIGSNWLYGMLNIMGTWRGNVEFAYPDLEVAIDDGKDAAYSGETLKYDITVRNNGYAAAEDTLLVLDLPKEISFASASRDTKFQSGSYVWDLEGLEPGESLSLKVKARVDDELEKDGKNAVATAQVQTKTAEKEKSNNSDSDNTIAKIDWDKFDSGYSYEDDLDVQRISTLGAPVRKGDVVSNSIMVKNDSDVPLYNVKLKEQLFEDGNGMIVEYEWSIGDMDVDDKILIDYSLLVNGFARTGEYTFTASAKGSDPFEDTVRSGKHEMPMNVVGGFANGFYGEGEGENPFTLVPAAQAFGPADQVLGASSARTCDYMPIWIWMSALAAYGLAINWSLFPFRGGIETGNIRMIALPSLATIATLAFWWIFRCDLMLWFAAAVFTILALHLIIKERQVRSKSTFPLKPA